MLAEAIKNDPQFSVSDIEIRRGGVSYSIDTVRQLKKLHPDARFYFIIGGDSVNELDTWKRIDELRKICTFIATGRPGFSVCASSTVNMFRGRRVNVSSSEIRERIAGGKSIRRLVPAAVARYIATHRLYLSKESPRSKRSN